MKLLIETEGNEDDRCGECPWLDGSGYCVFFDNEPLTGEESSGFSRCVQCVNAELDAKASGMREEIERRDHEKKMLARELFIHNIKDFPDTAGNTAENCIVNFLGTNMQGKKSSIRVEVRKCRLYQRECHG